MENIEFSRTHNIVDLANVVRRIGYELPFEMEDAVFLNSVYRARYPVAMGLLPAGEPSKEDAVRALNISERM